MKKRRIRPLALVVFRRGNRILVSEGYDRVKKETFYRPLGGGIEFGEPAREAARREIREELRAEIVNLRYRWTLENIFTLNGEPGHEIIRIFEADFRDAAFYRRKRIPVCEKGWKDRGVWKPLGDFRKDRLYPEGRLELLTSRLRGSTRG